MTSLFRMPVINYSTSTLLTVLKMREGKLTFGEMSVALEAPISTVQYWYKVAKRDEKKFEEWKKLRGENGNNA